MKILLIGATGMLGQVLNQKFTQENLDIFTISRTNSTYNIDLLVDTEKVIEIIRLVKPDVVVNSAALINLKDCEQYPKKAYILNARLPALLETACREINSYLVQISTDHYYKNDEKIRHSEKEDVVLLNEYARTKYAGEVFALTYRNTLVVRTNIVGFRNKKNEPTFIEWVIRSLQQEEMITGFEDFYTSSIDIYSFAEILMELIEQNVTGIINVATTDVYSKYEFIYELAEKIGKEQFVSKGKMNSFEGIKRANSLGLDTTKLQSILCYQLVPCTEQVINNLIEKYRAGAFYELSE